MLKPNRLKTFLWFDGQAEEAAHFYAAIFPESRIGRAVRYPKGSPGTAGNVMTVEFQLEGRDFVALNGGPQFKFTEAVSFAIECDTQEELDYYWERLLADGGKAQMCGWLKDKFGLSWQVTPAVLGELLSNPKTAERAMQAVLKMVKFDLRELLEASR